MSATTAIAPPQPKLTPQEADMIAGGAIASCGQAYDFDLPRFYPDGGYWETSVWAAHHRTGRIERIGSVRVDDSKREAIFGEEDRLRLKTACQAALDKPSNC